MQILDEEIKNFPEQRDSEKKVEQKAKKLLKDFEYMVKGFRDSVEEEVNNFYYNQIS